MESALANSSIQRIALASDVELPAGGADGGPLVVSGVLKEVDGRGHAVTVAGGGSATLEAADYARFSDVVLGAGVHVRLLQGGELSGVLGSGGLESGGAVQVEGCELSGLSVDNGSGSLVRGSAVAGSVIFARSLGCRVEGCTVETEGWCAVLLGPGSGSVSCDVTGSTLRGGQYGFYAGLYGCRVEVSDSVVEGGVSGVYNEGGHGGGEIALRDVEVRSGSAAGVQCVGGGLVSVAPGSTLALSTSGNTGVSLANGGTLRVGEGASVEHADAAYTAYRDATSGVECQQNQLMAFPTPQSSSVGYYVVQKTEVSFSWSEDYSDVDATVSYINDSAQQFVQKADVFSEIAVVPTCTKKGKTTYRASFGPFNDVRTVENIPEIGHRWGEVTYWWTEDDSLVTAIRTCENDVSHVESETIKTDTEVVFEPDCERAGSVILKFGTFANPAFEIQSKIVEVPALGRDYAAVRVEESTESEAGYTLYRCSRCGDELVGDRTDPLGPSDDARAAAAVRDAIAALPAAADLSLPDAEAVEAARAAYEALAPERQALVTNLAMLVEAEGCIAKLRAEAQTAADAAASVDAAIAGLPAVEELKLSDKDAVGTARGAYDALTATQKALVEGLPKLEAAEARIAQLEAAAAEQAAREQAEKEAAEKESRDRAERAARESAEKEAADRQAAEEAGREAEALKAASTGKGVRVTSGDGAALVADVSASGAATVTGAAAGAQSGTLSIGTVRTADGASHAVTAIAAGAFRGTSAKSVAVGYSVITVGASAFANAKKLTTAKIGDGAVSLGKNVFKGGAKLRKAVIGRSVRNVGKGAFAGCKKLKVLTVRSANLTEKSCRNMLKGSSVKTVKIKGMTKAQKGKALKNYRKWFPKMVAGKKLVIM